MNFKKLREHVKLCKKNLRSTKVKCCANCPFEDEIVDHYPDMKQLFFMKRTAVFITKIEGAHKRAANSKLVFKKNSKSKNLE